MQRKSNGQLVFSPSDLTRFFESPFASWMDRLHLERPAAVTPDEISEEQLLFSNAGSTHEAEFQESLHDAGHDVCEIVGEHDDEKLRRTRHAMQEQRQIIAQAYLRADVFGGYADFLNLVGKPYPHYEVWDTKLARRPRPYFVIQLCCYAEMLEAMQGIRPRQFEIILGDGTRKRFRTDDFFFHYRQVRRAFLEQCERFDPAADPPPPDPRRNHGRWQSHAERWSQERDHLCQVAGITSGQIAHLNTAGIETLEQLGTRDVVCVPRISNDVLGRLRSQAAIQLKSRTRHREQQDHAPPPAYELRSEADQQGRGLASLPPASSQDVYFDIEGYPVGDGLEYLLGAVTVDTGEPVFRDWWAHDTAQEREAFQSFVDWVFDRWMRDRRLHIYHYAQYEVTALRRLMGRHGTREREIDELLRHEVFVDLYRIVRNSILLGAPDYSLKSVERIYQPQRSGDVTTAAASIVYYGRWLQSGEPQDLSGSPILQQIRDYNEVDCVSTWKAAEWLRTLQGESGSNISSGSAVAEEEDLAELPGNENRQRRARRSEAMRAEIPKTLDERRRRAGQWDIQELLAWLLEFHRREEKPFWWAWFDRLTMTEQELWEDPDCLSGLQRTADDAVSIRQSLGFWYRFDPDQESKVRQGAKVRPVNEELPPLHVEDMDAGGRILLRLSRRALSGIPGESLPRRLTIALFDNYPSEPLDTAIEQVVESWCDRRSLPPALKRFLLRQPPKLTGHRAGDALLQPNEAAVDGCCRLGTTMRESTLCIQGPPGTGKTYVASRMVRALVDAGHRVAVTSNSHKAICKPKSPAGDAAGLP